MEKSNYSMRASSTSNWDSPDSRIIKIVLGAQDAVVRWVFSADIHVEICAGVNATSAWPSFLF
jgi:hypothetical protein